MIRYIISTLAVFWLSSNAYSFEVDGFRSGMSMNEAKKMLLNQNREKVEMEEGRLMAWDTAEKQRFINIGFCKGKVVQVEKHLQPRFDIFIRLVEDKRNELGKPIDAWSEPIDPMSTVEKSSVSFAWKRSKDIVTATYTEFKHNNQLSVNFETQNSCWKTRY